MTTSSKTNEEGDWRNEVRSWYRGYSEYEKLLVLNTQDRMIDFIDKLISQAKEAGRKEERGRCKNIILDNMSLYDTSMNDGGKMLQELGSK